MCVCVCGGGGVCVCACVCMCVVCVSTIQGVQLPTLDDDINMSIVRVYSGPITTTQVVNLTVTVKETQICNKHN